MGRNPCFRSFFYERGCGCFLPIPKNKEPAPKGQLKCARVKNQLLLFLQEHRLAGRTAILYVNQVVTRRQGADRQLSTPFSGLKFQAGGNVALQAEHPDSNWPFWCFLPFDGKSMSCRNGVELQAVPERRHLHGQDL